MDEENLLAEMAGSFDRAMVQYTMASLTAASVLPLAALAQGDTPEQKAKHLAALVNEFDRELLRLAAERQAELKPDTIDATYDDEPDAPPADTAPDAAPPAPASTEIGPIGLPYPRPY